MSGHSVSNHAPKISDMGILLVGHGTRDPRGQQEFTALVSRLAKSRPDLRVAGGYLEIAQPSIAEAVGELVSRGARSIVAIPLLLLAAGHAKQDVPEALEFAARQHPGLKIRLAGHLGCHTAMLNLAHRRRQTAQRLTTPSDAVTHPSWGEMTASSDIDPDDRVLLVVGRGSGDHAAQAELREFARLSGQMTDERHVRACFLAMARPSLDERIAELAESRFRAIVVQPHILFMGDLLERVQKRVAEAAAADRQRAWYLTQHLGPEDELVETILARKLEALTGFLPKSSLSS